LRIPVLFYHKIGYPPPEAKLVNLYVTPENFYKQLKYLKLRGFRTINCETYFKIRRNLMNPPYKPILITFDDGFKNNYTYAFPILKKFGFIATIFIVVGDIGKKVRWEESEEDLPEEILSWEEIKEMHRYGIDFQSHGFTHRHLDALPVEEVEEEIKNSKRILEENLEKKIEFFAYPYGSYNEKVKEILKKHGFKAGFTTRKGKERDLYEIRRVGIKYKHKLWKFIRYVEWKY